MSRLTRTFAWAVLTALVVIPLVSLSAATPSDSPTLTEALTDRLLNLPYGLADQNGLILRMKHVDSVQFYGAGSGSKFSFQRSQSIMPGGVSLRLRNTGKFSWASGALHFKKPLDVTRYNSVVIWVRSTHPGLRFWIGLQDPHWSVADRQQARTDILPMEGLFNQPIQLVVPFAAIYSDEPVDYSKLSQLQFEFGEDTVGNEADGEIEILGIAFVHQKKNITLARIVTLHSTVWAERLPVHHDESTVARATEADEVVPKPVADARPANHAAQTAQLLLKMTESETTTFFKNMGFEMKHPEAPKKLATAKPVEARTKTLATNGVNFGWPVATAGSAGLAVFAGTLWVLTRRRNGHHLRQLPKIFHAIHWPFTVTESTSLARFQRDFWKGLSAERVKVGWLSVTGATVDKTSDEEFYGARFLERQVKLAGEAGVRVFPSLSFVKTVFHYESFLANPKIYHVRPVDEDDRELTDAELRLKEKHAFPVWVPSFWQNKFNLPYRVLIETGKLPATPANKGLVQYNLTSPELRAMAVRTIERFAEIAPGVRIEDAAALLSTKLLPPVKPSRSRKSAASKNGTAHAEVSGNGAGVNGMTKAENSGPAGTPEFWSEVIAAVKLRHPDFLFVAGSGTAAEDGAALRAFGFDYVENTAVVDTLIDQVRAGSVSTLDKVLTTHTRVLKDSVYDVSPLIRPAAAAEVTQRQNLLSTIILALLPGVLQHDDNLPDDVTAFIQRISRSTVLRKGQFMMLPTNSTNVMAFARWRRRALFLAVANFSSVAQETLVRLHPITDGIDDNKLYLFNNAVHGTELLRNIINTGNGGPAMALWGQNLRDTGVNVRLPGLSLKLFSVNLTRPIPTVTAKEEILTAAAR